MTNNEAKLITTLGTGLIAGYIAKELTRNYGAKKSRNFGRFVAGLTMAAMYKRACTQQGVKTSGGSDLPAITNPHDKISKSLDTVIEILQESEKLSRNTKSVISASLVNNLYKAENKRMSFLEKIGIDGKTIGRGQLSQDAYDDVVKIYTTEIGIYEIVRNLEFSGNFYKDMKNPEIEDFIVSAYLAICIENRQKIGRSADDAAKFGIGFYHGARNTIYAAQESSNDLLSFSGPEKVLKNGNEKQKDLIRYIEEVFYGEN